jgi:hypothetical protein
MCGTEYLYPSAGANNDFTRPACFVANATDTQILYLTSPVFCKLPPAQSLLYQA